VVVEVVAREVAEDHGVELDAGGAVLGERVRADLEGAGAVAGIQHLPEHALQVQRLRGGEHDGVIDAADAVHHRAQQRALLTRRGHDAGHEVCGGGLAVGPGDAHHAQLARRLAVPARPHEGHGEAHGRHDHLGHRDAGGPFADHGGRARGHSAGREVVPVEGEPGHTKEKRAVGDVTRVVGEATDVGGRIATHGGAFDPLDQLGKLHRGGFYQKALAAFPCADSPPRGRRAAAVLTGRSPGAAGRSA
jgi:hypothetical protein